MYWIPVSNNCFSKRSLQCSLFGLLFAFTTFFHFEIQSSEARSTRSMVEQWIKAEKALDKARADWKLDQQNLETEKRLLLEEKRILEQQISSLDAQQDSAASARQDLAQELDGLETRRNHVIARVTASEQALKKLYPQLPPALGRKIGAAWSGSATSDNESQSVPVKDTFMRRLQRLIGAWTEVHQFQNELTALKEVIRLNDSTNIEVEVLYLGLAQAYFVSPDDQRGGIGRPSPSGWVWTEISELGPEVRKALRSMELPDPREPAMLPIELK